MKNPSHHLQRHALSRALFIAVVSASLFGCFGSTIDRLPKETKFRHLAAVADLAGSFEDQGRSPSGEWRPRLSEVLFPPQTFAEPPSHVRLQCPAPTTLRCEAIAHGEVVARHDLVAGTDFHLADGRLRLDRRLIEPVITAAGAGFGTDATYLRLNDAGDAVLIFHGGGVGMMLFIVPWGGVRKQEAVFRRVELDDAPATPAR